MTRKIMVAMVALLCAALAIGALGCGSKANGNPEQSVTDFWNALKKGDVKGAWEFSLHGPEGYRVAGKP